MFSIATSQTHFLFNGKILDPVDCVAMGCPLAPVLANLFIGHHEIIWLKNYQGPSVLFYRRYVDDTFSVFHTEKEAISFLTFSILKILISNSLLKKKPARFQLFLMCLLIIIILLVSKLQPIGKNVYWIAHKFFRLYFLLLQSWANPYFGGKSIQNE